MKPKPPWVNHIRSNWRACYVTELPLVGADHITYIVISTGLHWGWNTKTARYYAQNSKWVCAEFEMAFMVDYKFLSEMDLALGACPDMPLYFS